MVSWAHPMAARMPQTIAYRNNPQAQALLAISRLLNCYAVDLSGTLNWPCGNRRIASLPLPEHAGTAAECLDRRAQEVWQACDDRVIVLCAGDIDSTAVVAALLKHTDTPERIEVRYTGSCLDRYAELFQKVLPATGVRLAERTGLALVGDSPLPFLDGRSGDDWQAGYLAKAAQRWDLTGSLAATLDRIARQAGPNPELIGLARDGLALFVEQFPYPITTSWELFVVIYRYCMTQWDTLIAGIIEPDPQRAILQRVPFFDSPAFSAGTLGIIEGGIPKPEDESLGMRNYVAEVLGTEEWAKDARPESAYYVYNPSQFLTSWLDDEFRLRSFSEFPW